MIFSCRVILCLINGGSQTKNRCIRNFQWHLRLHSREAAQDRGTASSVLIHRYPFPLLLLTVSYLESVVAARTFTLLQKIKTGYLSLSHTAQKNARDHYQ